MERRFLQMVQLAAVPLTASESQIPDRITCPFHSMNSQSICPYLLDVVIRKSATVLKLLSGEDQTLLVRGNSLLILDLGLDIVDRIGGLDLEGDGLARKGLDEAVICQSRIRGCRNFAARWRGRFWESLHLHC
jgi:hypothetical protein